MHRSAAWDADEDAYAVLGVPFGAGDAEIAAAYRALARRHHPDIAGEAETARMSAINAAFDRLRARRRSGGANGARRPTPPRHSPASTSPTGGPSSTSSRHDPTRPAYGWFRERDGTGGAGPPPGRPSGSVLRFGRHLNWSIGEIARVDPGYLEWLERRPEGRPYQAEIDETLRRIGFRGDRASAANGRV